MDNWTFLRFGDVNRNGASIFGMDKAGSEDSPSEWAVATGNKRSEDGICAFRVRRHLDDPRGCVLEMPQFERALYQINNADRYLMGIAQGGLCAHFANPAVSPAFLMRGSLSTRLMGNRRHQFKVCSLGSDGEYLIDHRKPFTKTPIGLDRIYVSDDERMDAFLKRMRFACDNDYD
jgi:hypothetical protein